MSDDPVNHPKHYTSHPSGVECIQITEHMGFNLGNAVKYIWRADLKADAIQDLEKASWYLAREIARRRGFPPLVTVEPGAKAWLNAGGAQDSWSPRGPVGTPR